MKTDEFSVYQFFPDESYERVVEFVSFEKAARVAYQCCTSVGAKIGITQRVMLTDGGDCIVYEWIYGQGITYPPELVGKILGGPPPEIQEPPKGNENIPNN